MMEAENSELVLKVELVDDVVYLAMHFSDDEVAEEGCDSCIDFTVYNLDGVETDGGQLDYNSAETEYLSIEDAVDDILEFAFDTNDVVQYEISDKTEDEILRGNL